MVQSDAGIRFADNFRKDGQGPTVINALAREGFVAGRIAHFEPHLEVGEIEPASAFVLSYALTPFRRSSLWLDNRPADWHPVRPGELGELHIYNLADRIRADIPEPLEFVYMYLPGGELDHFADEHEIPGIGSCPFRSGGGLTDPAMADVAARLLPMIAAGALADQLLLDELVTKLQLQFLSRFAPLRGRDVAYRGGLAPWQQRRAKGLMDAHLTGGISVARLATECGLSRSHFLQAFRHTTGVTAHRWLLNRRVEVSKRLLMWSSLPLAEIALTCGFAHHAHFSRVFSRRVGAPPGAWRALNRARLQGSPLDGATSL